MENNITSLQRFVNRIFKNTYFILIVFFGINHSAIQAQFVPELKVNISDNNEQSLKLQTLKIDIKVIGNLAITTMDMTFTNDFPNKRQYEGTLLFPIADGQLIHRLAMDINGVMREGVIVEKEKGRIVFEDIERKNVDPALLEKTTSNNYKLRVFPIIAKQEKHIIIAYEETLKSEENSMRYNLPLNYDYKIDDFTLTAKVFSDYPVKNSKSNQLEEVEFDKEDNAYAMRVHFKNYLADKLFSFSMPLPDDNQDVITETINGVNYFSINRNIKQAEEIPLKVENVSILWDCSHSSKYRDIEREIELLKEFFKSNNKCNVELITFNYKIKSKEKLTIINGNISELIASLSKIKYDGGSNFDCINLENTKSDIVLLYSDGISSIGNSQKINSKVPVYAITSSIMQNSPYLNELSSRTGGNYINLLTLEESQITNLLLNKTYRLISVGYDPVLNNEVYPKSTSNIIEGLTIAGKMTGNYSEITLNFGYGNTVTKSEIITIDKNKDEVNTNILDRIWAKKKLDDLQNDKITNKDEILKLGSLYNIVTDETSLIILETAIDYVHYNIEAPKNDEILYENYIKIVNVRKKHNDNGITDNKYQIEMLIDAFNERKEWYNKQFITNEKELKKLIEKRKSKSKEGVYENVPRTGRSDYSVSDEPSDMDAFIPSSTPAASNLRSARQSQAEASSISGTGSSRKSTRNAPTAASISLNSYKSNAEYFKDFQSDKLNSDSIYFKNKEKYGNSIGFYIDISEIYTEKGKNEEAAEIITNIAELSQENQEFLRIVAYKLQYLGEIDLAIKLFEYIKEIRSEEPQSYRDLAFAFVDKEEYQKACDLLYEMAQRAWDSRFKGVNLTAITEMNAIISKYKNKVNISKYNPNLIYPMPLDMRIVLRWDLDNTDIDLWVTDPVKEKCYYNYKLTLSGGLLPKDFTGGYGPEEFIIKNALKGLYIVECNYFGSRAVKMTGGATLFLDLYTNYGTINESKKTIVYRVKKDKETVKITEYEFK